MNAERVIRIGLLLFGAIAVEARQTSAQPAAQSFAALQSTLKAGDGVVVRDDHGDVQGGTVDSIDAQQLVIRWPTGFIHRRDRDVRKVYLEDAVRRIEKIDSDTDGMLIGAGIGLVLTWGCVAASRHDETGGVGCIVFAPLGVEIGQRVDNARYRLVYVSPQRTTVSIRPLLTPRQAALTVSLSF